MKKSLQAWVDELTGFELPVFARTLASLHGLQSEAGNLSGAKIASSVLPDAMMVLKVMRLANSGRRGRFAQPILTIEHSVMMVGLNPVFDRLLVSQSLDSALPDDARSGLVRLASRSFHAAYQARDWSVLRLDMNVEEVYIAAMLQEMGAMCLWCVSPATMVELSHRYKSLPRSEAEEDVLGFTLDEMTLALAKAWNLPPLISSALIPSECDAHVRARLVAIARRMARDTESGWYGETLVEDVATLAEALRLSVDEINAKVHRSAVDCARTCRFDGVTPVAAWLPMLPGPWPDDAQEATAEISTSSISAADPGPAADPFQQALLNLSSHMDGTLTLDKVMMVVVRGMQQGIGLRRIVFALLTQDRKQLRARFVVGAEEGASLRQFNFDLTRPGLFVRLLEKQQSFWLNEEMRPKVAPLLDAHLLETISASQFFAMSVAVHGKVIGLFYADGGDGDHPLEPQQYDQFKQLCTRASQTMGHLAKG